MRLTEKDINGKCYGYDIGVSMKDELIAGAKIKNCICKLGQLEDIEDELGIELITLLKTLKSESGILVKNSQGIRRYDYRSRSYLTFGYDEYGGWYFTYKAKNMPQYFIKDYGKTWALTKEELK